MNNVDDLWEHIAYVMAYAPNNFPHRDFISDDQQMNLDRAFNQLHEGVAIAFPGPDHSTRRTLLTNILNSSYNAYKKGDEIVAAELLNKFQDEVFEE